MIQWSRRPYKSIHIDKHLLDGASAESDQERQFQAPETAAWSSADSIPTVATPLSVFTSAIPESSSSGPGHIPYSAVDIPVSQKLPILPVQQSRDNFPALPSGVRGFTCQSRTALHIAVCNGDESIVQLLLDRGANLSKQDCNGSTALHLAAELGRWNLVKLLLEKSAHPNQINDLGQTALFAAVRNDDEKTTKLLLDYSVDVNLKDLNGTVALHLAVGIGSESMTKLLLAHGADVDA